MEDVLEFFECPYNLRNAIKPILKTHSVKYCIETASSNTKGCKLLELFKPKIKK